MGDRSMISKEPPRQLDVIRGLA